MRHNNSKPKTANKRDRDDNADEEDLQITMSKSAYFKPAASQFETINRDIDTEDEVSRPVTKSRAVVSSKPSKIALETILLSKPKTTQT